MSYVTVFQRVLRYDNTIACFKALKDAITVQPQLFADLWSHFGPACLFRVLHEGCRF